MRTLLLAAWLAQPVVIPFTTTSDGFVLIPATVAGNIPVHLILDTGAGFDVLAQSLVDRLQLKPTSQFTGFVFSGDRVDAPLYPLNTIAVGSFARTNVPVAGLALLDQVHQDGILSISGFRTQPITIDFVKHVVVLETPSSLAERKKSGTAVPLQFDDYRGVTRCSRATARTSRGCRSSRRIPWRSTSRACRSPTSSVIAPSASTSGPARS